MSPGCSMSNNHNHHQSQHYTTANIKSTNQIPLPPSTKPTKHNYKPLDTTVDTFEILEQTIMKQKRLGRSKNTDMRVKILLKRTFNLVCELMDKENGFGTTTTEIVPENVEQEETLIINLSETESLDDLAFESNDDYIELESFNYENLLETTEALKEETHEEDVLQEKKSYYLFNDLTNKSTKSKKRCFSSGSDDDDDDTGIIVKKFKESSSNSIHIVS